MVRAHRRIALAALLLSACFVDPGKGGTAGDGTSTGTTAAATTGPAPTTTAGTTASSSTTSSVEDSATDVPTTGPVCATYGQPCAEGTPCCGCLTCEGDTCKPQDAACDDCNECDDDGACRKAPDGDSCDLDVDPCEQTAFGVENGTCYAALPGGGLCDDGACISGGCIGKGEPVFTCPDCVRDDHKCQPGATLVGLTLADLCHLNEPAPNCQVRCDLSFLYDATCNATGACVLVDEDYDSLCPGYACNAEGTGCKTTCNSDADCAQPSYACDFNSGQCYLQ
jgi:hypothetical protein